MAIYRWIYASTSELPVQRIGAEIDDIVSASAPRNATLDVTGVLIFARCRFAQYLEGPQDAIEELMASILRDPRHRDIMTLSYGAHDRRAFGNWALAYRGGSTFIAEQIAFAINDVTGNAEGGVDRLVEIMREFVSVGDLQ